VLTLWYHGDEEYLARVLIASRPSVWLFPALEELHLGASGQHLQNVPKLLSPSLKSLRLNHWNINLPMAMTHSHPIKRTLMHVCALPALQHLDLMDTRYTDFETDQELVMAFANLASRLHEIRAYSFFALPPIFRALSRNDDLRLLCLSLEESEGYLPLGDILTGVRVSFPGLKTLCLLCTVGQATVALRQIQRVLEGLELRIEAQVGAEELDALITTVLDETPTLRIFRLSCDAAMFCDVLPPIRISEVFHPFVGMKELRHFHITLGFTGDQTIRDVEMRILLGAWPHLRTCIIESDPIDPSIPRDAENTDYGLTLEALGSAATLCRRLEQLELPYVNTSRIPDTEGVPKAYQHFSLQISRSHVHNHAALVSFVASLWPNCTVNVGGCSHFESTTTTTS